MSLKTNAAPSAVVAEYAADRIRERADAAIGPIWSLSVETLREGNRAKALAGFSDEELAALADPAAAADGDLPGEDETAEGEAADESEQPSDSTQEGGDASPKADASEPERPTDKLFVLTIRGEANGYVVSGVEYDAILHRVGRRIKSEPCELSVVGESAFTLLCELFSPVALFDVDRKNGEVVTLRFRGSQLPQRAAAPNWTPPDSVLLPVLIRTTREGGIAENGIQEAPWTYFLLEDEAPTSGETAAPEVSSEDIAAEEQTRCRTDFAKRRECQRRRRPKRCGAAR